MPYHTKTIQETKLGIGAKDKKSPAILIMDAQTGLSLHPSKSDH